MKLNSLIPAALLAATIAFAATPAMALECNSGQGQAVELDFKVDVDNKPLTTLSLREVSVACVDWHTTYTLRGMAGEFGSASAAKRAYELTRDLLELGLTGEDIAQMVGFVSEKEKEVVLSRPVVPTN